MTNPTPHRLVPGQPVELSSLPTAGEGDRKAFIHEYFGLPYHDPDTGSEC